jgi:hypothetical protein
MKKILLVTSEFKAPGWDVKNLPVVQKKSLVTPLHLATIAALTPEDIEVDLWDEAVHGWIDDATEFDKEFDLVGITSHALILHRVKKIAQVFRRRGIPVAIGGIDVSSSSRFFRNDADILFFGEAELTWPQFIADWRAGSYRKEYREFTFPDLALSPLPRWDSIADDIPSYLAGTVQTSRGCSFDCDFCQISYLYGRQMRHKPIDKILKEVATLERLGMVSILFCDSNFIGNPRYTKNLLRELIPLNNSFAQPLRFQTDLTINVANDDELLALLADANFNMLLIGIESPNKESLKETNKLQNVRSDLVADCKKIMSYGIPIEASMIVGFDHDTSEIYDQLFQFHQESHMPSTKINILKALQGTRLQSRLIKDGRFLNVDKGLYDENGFFSKDTRGATISDYLNLAERLYDWDTFASHVKEFVSNVKRQPNVPQKSGPQQDLSPALTSFILSMDEKAKSTIFNIALHTRQKAPFMMRKVIALISRQYLEAINLPLLREAILKQIEFEASVDIEQFIEKSEDRWEEKN